MELLGTIYYKDLEQGYILKGTIIKADDLYEVNHGSKEKVIIALVEHGKQKKIKVLNHQEVMGNQLALKTLYSKQTRRAAIETEIRALQRRLRSI